MISETYCLYLSRATSLAQFHGVTLALSQRSYPLVQLFDAVSLRGDELQSIQGDHDQGVTGAIPGASPSPMGRVGHIYRTPS